jgi:hypothetical protein
MPSGVCIILITFPFGRRHYLGNDIPVGLLGGKGRKAALQCPSR